ncbi:shikimate dehydrogenase [Palleronia sp. LCG004]|uniref:shikimate dehydrogenase family protein n=1 Tax=Palleronia sp. LCG004 TaxID=3079304 RepID=UPI002943D4E7|nr:shikimate dehydrogenase [Palleronia sp. LCG004]WOI56302.1 shikimate dehydrogenase [Palleronia sp. LCG004]
MDLRLGLIGDHITRSRAPRLHRLAGGQSGIDVRYDSLIPADLGQGFDEILDACGKGGYRGVNVTYPYKERAAALVPVEDPLVQAMGAINTVIFGEDGPVGYNTDHTGFIAAYERTRGKAEPGVCLMIGAGGAGRAVAFALAALGLRELRLVDLDIGRAERLALDLQEARPEVIVRIGPDPVSMAEGAHGILNCTPLGMDDNQDAALGAEAMEGAEWVFDAVYTPRDTPFLKGAATAGCQIVPGWELFFYQGVHAWTLFADRQLDEDRLRRDLLAEEEAGSAPGAPGAPGADNS